MTQTFAHAGYDIPVNLINMTGSGPDLFGFIGGRMLEDLREHIELRPDHSVLEVGCGIGRCAIPLAEYMGDCGSYVGIDIIKPSIDWCAANITPRHPRFRFQHFDVKDQLHNPGGTMDPRAVRLPVPSRSVDRVVLWSVFTHLFRPEIVHYLREFRRVLKPGGLVFASCFVVDDAIRASARVHGGQLQFDHEHEPGCRIVDPVHPLGAVAYTREALVRMVECGGLDLDRLVPGGWSGIIKSKYGQDFMVLRRRETWLSRFIR